MIPCLNEELTVGTVIRDFRAALPDARIVVCDNASTDKTAEMAITAGAEVIYEDLPGKGNAIRRLFSDIDADIYLMVDGDATYEASLAPDLVAHLLETPAGYGLCKTGCHPTGRVSQGACSGKPDVFQNCCQRIRATV